MKNVPNALLEKRFLYPKLLNPILNLLETDSPR